MGGEGRGGELNGYGRRGEGVAMGIKGVWEERGGGSHGN